jgi:hypothetical protein
MIFLGETVLQVRAATFARCYFFHSQPDRSGNEEARLRKKKWMLISSRLHVQPNKQRFRTS